MVGMPIFSSLSGPTHHHSILDLKKNCSFSDIMESFWTAWVPLCPHWHGFLKRSPWQSTWCAWGQGQAEAFSLSLALPLFLVRLQMFLCHALLCKMDGRTYLNRTSGVIELLLCSTPGGVQDTEHQQSQRSEEAGDCGFETGREITDRTGFWAVKTRVSMKLCCHSVYELGFTRCLWTPCADLTHGDKNSYLTRV